MTKGTSDNHHNIVIEHVSGRPDQGPEHPLPNRAGLHHFCCGDMPQYARMYCILPGVQRKKSKQAVTPLSPLYAQYVPFPSAPMFSCSVSIGMPVELSYL